MANIIEYVKYYRNKTFEEIPFNEVDALIFANLSYLNFNNCLKQLPITIEELTNVYILQMTPDKLKKESKVYRDAHHMLMAMNLSNRYKNLLITNYKKVIANEIQFGAITIKSNYFTYISFEGTNSYISGWKEDCHLSHRYPIPSQILAKEYINKTIKDDDKIIYIGGHSKGGNLAVAGAMESSLNIQNRIQAIYDFDGPGMREQEFLSQKYQLIKNKIKKYVPNHSIVGMLMYSPANLRVVNTTAKSILQHYPSSWNCFGSFFVEDSLSRKSIRFSREIKKFVKEYKEEEMERFVETIFTSLKNIGINQTDIITISKITKSIMHINNLNVDKETKEKALKLVNMLIQLHR